MNQTFEGLRTANEFAETTSKKMSSELFVVKCGSTGSLGINYQVRASLKDMRPGEKMMGKYKNGQSVK